MDRKRITMSNEYDFLVIELGPEDELNHSTDNFFPELEYVTILRDPLDTIYSRYLHVTNNGLLSKEPFEKWVHLIPRKNMFTSFLTSSSSYESDLDIAKKKSTNINFMFLTTIDQDIEVMRSFGWRNLDYNLFRSGTAHGANVRHAYRKNPKFLKQLENMWADDLELYQYLFSNRS